MWSKAGLALRGNSEEDWVEMEWTTFIKPMKDLVNRGQTSAEVHNSNVSRLFHKKSTTQNGQICQPLFGLSYITAIISFEERNC